MGVVEILIKAKDLTGAAFASTKMKLAAMKTSVGKVQKGYMTLGSKIQSVMSAAIMPIMLVVAAVYAIGRAVGSVTGQFGEFESAMKGVQKTTGMSDEEVAALGDDFKELSREVPKSAVELAEIGKIAGQLGIEGAENIENFTRTVAEASVAFDMNAADAALGLAALVKIYGKTIPEAVNLGSAINELGNTTGASEEQILRFTTSLGPSGEMLGFTAGQAIGIGATLIELKMDASAAGTQMNSAFTLMGQRLPQVSELLGISEQAFKDAFGADPMAMLINVIEKIKDIKDPLDQNTMATKIFGRIGAKSIRGLMKDTGRLKENVDKATKAYEEGTAMHEEYLIFASSFESKLELIKNKANLAAIAVGEKLAPSILALGNALTDTVIPALTALATAIGAQTEETWPAFKNTVAEAFGSLVGNSDIVTWENMMKTLGTAIGTIINGILIGIGFIIDANMPFLIAIGGMVTCISEFVSDIRNLSVKEAFENLGKNIFAALGDIKDDISGKVMPIVDAIITGLGKVKDKVAPIFEEVKTAIFTKLGSIKENLGEVLDPVKTAIHNKLAAIKDGLAEKLAPVTTIVLKVLSDIEDKLDPIISPIKTAIHNKLGGIKEGLAEKLAPVKTTIEGVFTSAVGIIETAFADLPTAIGTIFTTIGKAITTFGENLPGFLGTSVADLGESFTSLGDSFKIPTEDIEEDLGEVTGYVDLVDIAIGLMIGSWDKVPAAVEEVAAATKTMEEDAKADLDKLTIDVDGTKVTFDGLKGKITDVVTEFGHFEKIAGELIGLDWSVFTTLKEELPKIDKGIGDMKKAFGDLKTVLDNNIDNLETIQKDLGSIEEVITPFVNNIAPGISAIGDFGKALSDTQSALGVFASMSEVDIEGMLGFEGAVHSMVMGLDILDGQIERLMPSFSDMEVLIRNVVITFTGFEDPIKNAKEELVGLWREFQETNDRMVLATYNAKVFNYGLEGLAHSSDLWGTSEEKLIKYLDKHLDVETVLNAKMNETTGALKTQTSQLTKIGDAIQPLIDFMGTLNELFEAVFGDKAPIWDIETVQGVFEAIGNAIGFMGEVLGTLDFGEIIGGAIDSSEDFRTAMVEDGSQLSVLTNYIDILLGNYVELAELMGRLAEAEGDMGVETFEVSQAFDTLSGYLEGLATHLPTLTKELGTLNDIWGENGESIEESMTSYYKLMSIINALSLSYGDFAGTMMKVSQAQDTAASLGVDLSKSFEMVVEFVSELADVIPTLATELNTLGDIWKENEEAVSNGAAAFGKAMEPIENISDGMLDFGNVMVVAGDDIGGKFDTITDYIDKLTDFTPRLALALSGLKTVWDENSGAIDDGTTAFSNIVGAISDVQTSIGDLITAEGDLQTAANDASGAVNDESDALAGHSLSTSLDTTTTASALLQAATVALSSVMGPLTGTVNTAATALSDDLVSALTVAAEGAVSFMNHFVEGIGGAIPAIEEASWFAAKPLADSFSSAADHVRGIAETLADRFTAGINIAIPAIEEASWFAAKPLADSFSSAADHVGGVLASVANSVLLWGSSIAFQFANGLRSGISAVKAAAGALGSATSRMASLAGGAYSAGASIGHSFADGIYSGISAVEDAAGALAGVVASYLSVHSNTELGALSDLMEWGPNVVKTFKMGIQGELVSLSKTLNDMSLGGVSMSGGIGSGGGNINKNVYISINQNISSRTDADYAVKEIERLMKKPQII